MESALSYSSAGKDMARLVEDTKILTERLQNDLLSTELHTHRTNISTTNNSSSSNNSSSTTNRTALMNNIQGAISADNVIGILLLIEVQAGDLPELCVGQFLDIVRAAIGVARTNKAAALVVAKNSELLSIRMHYLCYRLCSFVQLL
jgi:hypothetical protein